MSTETGGPAFPQDIGWCSPNQHVQYRGPQGGMTLRDYFAAKAMQGLIASPRGLVNGKNEITDTDYAQAAYLVADAMLKARAA